MSMTTKSLALTAVIASSIAGMAADSAPRSRADELRPATAGSATQGSAAQSTSGQGSSAQGTWDAATSARSSRAWARSRSRRPLPGGRIAEILVKPERGSVRRRAVGRASTTRKRSRQRCRGRGAGRFAQARAQRSVGASGFGGSAQGRGRRRRCGACSGRCAPPALDKTTADWRANPRDARRLSTRPRHRLSRARKIACASGRDARKIAAPPPTRRCRRAWKASSTSRKPNGRVAQAALEKTQIRAPADGVVLRVDAKNGELAVPAAGPPIMSIGDVSASARARRGERAGSRPRSGSDRRCWCGPAPFHGREFDGQRPSIARVVGPSRINSRRSAQVQRCRRARGVGRFAQSRAACRRRTGRRLFQVGPLRAGRDA